MQSIVSERINDDGINDDGILEVESLIKDDHLTRRVRSINQSIDQVHRLLSTLVIRLRTLEVVKSSRFSSYSSWLSTEHRDSPPNRRISIARSQMHVILKSARTFLSLLTRLNKIFTIGHVSKCFTWQPRGGTHHLQGWSHPSTTWTGSGFFHTSRTTGCSCATSQSAATKRPAQ
jgi:hypothetical protein